MGTGIRNFEEVESAVSCNQINMEHKEGKVRKHKGFEPGCTIKRNGGDHRSSRVLFSDGVRRERGRYVPS